MDLEGWLERSLGSHNGIQTISNRVKDPRFEHCFVTDPYKTSVAHFWMNILWGVLRHWLVSSCTLTWLIWSVRHGFITRSAPIQRRTHDQTWSKLMSRVKPAAIRFQPHARTRENPESSGSASTWHSLCLDKISHCHQSLAGSVNVPLAGPRWSNAESHPAFGNNVRLANKAGSKTELRELLSVIFISFRVLLCNKIYTEQTHSIQRKHKAYYWAIWTFFL